MFLFQFRNIGQHLSIVFLCYIIPFTYKFGTNIKQPIFYIHIFYSVNYDCFLVFWDVFHPIDCYIQIFHFTFNF